MKAENVLTSITLISNKYPEIAHSPEYKALVQGLKEDIALGEQKKAGKGNRFKAALRFSKKVNKEFGETRPGMAGAFSGDKGEQYILHAHYAVRYDEPFEGLVMAQEGLKPASTETLFARYDTKLAVALPTLAELKIKLKTDKAEGKLNARGWSLTELGGNWYNTDYLIQAFEMVEPEEAYMVSKSKYSPIMLVGDGALGLVCPVKKQEN